jgi:alpha-galactosidase
MRAAVSFFGHMGMEMDPRELTDHEKARLKTIIALHKKHRDLIHSGKLERLESDGNSTDFGIVSHDKTQALYAYNSVTETKRTAPKKYHFKGIDETKSYRLNMIWPTDLKEYSESVLSKVENQVFTGQALSQFGMQLPIQFPQSALIFELNAV